MNAQSPRRLGVTLIELLVVIAVIVLLASLLLGGVMVAMKSGPPAVIKSDISQISLGLGRFKAEYGFYPPSRIHLRNSRAAYGATPLELQSLQIIGTMWPSIDFTNVRWDGSTGAVTTLNFILEGDQCLVFFLGGPPVYVAPPVPVFTQIPLQGGFSTDPKYPVGGSPVVGGAPPDLKRYFDFDNGRLLVLFDPLLPPPVLFPSFVDAYRKKPYLYFSSGRRTDGYDMTHEINLNRFPILQIPDSPPIVPTSTLPLYTTTKPYCKLLGKNFYNASTFQLISAGANEQFGPGGVWNQPGDARTNGKDDISNFYDKLLGN